MPTGDADWLALTPEPTLEPELPICDAHHHLWEFRPEPVPYQRYLLAELAEDLGSGHNVGRRCSSRSRRDTAPMARRTCVP
jgi:hypothetical protein